MDSKLQTNSNIPNNMPVTIIRGNENTCLLEEAAILRESFIFTFTLE
jgi:hypothetical protein